MGYRSAEIEDQKDVLKEFNLKIKLKMDSDTDAYINIRWKTQFEKRNYDRAAIMMPAKSENEEISRKNNNHVMQFLESE